MSHTHRKVMCRKLCKPFIHIEIGIFLEFYVCLCVSDSHNLCIGRFCFCDDKFHFSINCLCTAKSCDVTGTYLRFYRYTCTLFSVIYAKPTKQWFSIVISFAVYKYENTIFASGYIDIIFSFLYDFIKYLIKSRKYRKDWKC